MGYVGRNVYQLMVKNIVTAYDQNGQIHEGDHAELAICQIFGYCLNYHCYNYHFWQETMICLLAAAKNSIFSTAC